MSMNKIWEDKLVIAGIREGGMTAVGFFRCYEQEILTLENVVTFNPQSLPKNGGTVVFLPPPAQAVARSEMAAFHTRGWQAIPKDSYDTWVEFCDEVEFCDDQP
jgi:hypothetical protein